MVIDIKIIKYIAGGLAAGFINGFFGAGGGVIAVLALTHFCGMERRRAHATAIAIILPLSITSIIFYTRGGMLDFQVIWQVALGGVAGGYIGAKLLNKLSGKTVSRIFGIFMILAAVRMVW